jgi:hypothetical protein
MRKKTRRVPERNPPRYYSNTSLHTGFIAGSFDLRVLRRLAHRFLSLADGALDFSLDLLANVAFGGAGYVIGLAFGLFHFSRSYVFNAHKSSPW